MKDRAMNVLDKITLAALRSVVRAAWAIEAAGAHLKASGTRLDDWAGRLAGARGIDVLDELDPFLEARSVSLDA
jgi:hypothetical protein